MKYIIKCTPCTIFKDCMLPQGKIWHHDAPMLAGLDVLANAVGVPRGGKPCDTFILGDSRDL